MRDDVEPVSEMSAARLARRGNRSRPQGECARHRGALLELAEGRGGPHETAAALEHLASCRDCERELAKLALVLSALRRLADGVHSAAPAEPLWPAIHARLAERPRQRWKPGSLAGAFASLALVFVIAAPMLVRSGAPGARPTRPEEPTPVLQTAAPAVGSVPKTGLAIDAADLLPAQRSLPALYPDNLKPASDVMSGVQGRS